MGELEISLTINSIFEDLGIKKNFYDENLDIYGKLS